MLKGLPDRTKCEKEKEKKDNNETTHDKWQKKLESMYTLALLKGAHSQNSTKRRETCAYRHGRAHEHHVTNQAGHRAFFFLQGRGRCVSSYSHRFVDLLQF
jgi:hypothetical protein